MRVLFHCGTAGTEHVRGPSRRRISLLILSQISGALFLLCSLVLPAHADAVDRAITAAIAALEIALPRLGTVSDGVEVAAYRDALTLGRFTSAHWGGTVTLDIVEPGAEGACARFAAYVRIPPQNGTVTLAICPLFSQEGTDALRRLTILHEMVHVVAGPDECRAMAFAARVEQLATGTHTPVDRYWTANNCDGSGFSLP